MRHLRFRTRLLPLIAVAGLLVPWEGRPAGVPAGSVPGEPSIRPVRWPDVSPIVGRLSAALPPEIQAAPEAQRAARWDDWVAARRRQMDTRLQQGHADSLVNLLLFGTAFTTEPRITAELLEELNERWRAGDRSAQETLSLAYRRRAADLVRALASPGGSERLEMGRRTLARMGHDVSTERGRAAAADDLLAHVIRVRQESAALAAALEGARSSQQGTSAFVAESTIFRDRGLAPDSSLLTQFAVDRALCAIAPRGVLRPRSIRRIVIVGPGLDFADKQEGFDFYEPQSLQPFTAVDSLRQCGLSGADAPDVLAIDVSDRVLSHLRGARQRADAGAPYPIVLPLGGAAASEAAMRYWAGAGASIGTPFDVEVPGALSGVRARAVAVRPAVLRKLRVVEANVVLDRVSLPERERADLVIATNVLLYYDTFEQALAAAAIAGLLRPGGLLLTNTALLEIPELPLRSAGHVTVRFSESGSDGEHMVWYERRPE